MAGPNGLAALSPARRTIRVVSETITYDLIINDEPLSLIGYKKGPGCPLTVVMDVDDALATVHENEPTDEERGTDADPERGIEAVPGTLSPRRYLNKLTYAERTLRRDMLKAVIPGLTTEHANILASDGGPWRDMLVELGWRQSDAEILAAAEDAADPEAVGQASSTGLPDSLDSASPTTAETP